MAEGKAVFVNVSQGSDGQIGIANSTSESNNALHMKRCSSDRAEIANAEGNAAIMASHGKMLANSNGSSREELDSASGTTLPVNLTTPPLTPPREHSGGETPTNVNRNNVADSVHVKAAHFLANVRHGTIGNGMMEDQYSERPLQNGHSVPPALVIMTNEEPQDDAVTAGDQQGVVIGEEVQGTAAMDDRSQIPGLSSQRQETTESAPRSVKDVSSHGLGTDNDRMSSDDEEVEEMDLVLVVEGGEDEEREGGVRGKDGQRGRRGGSVTSTENKSSASNYSLSMATSENGGVVATVGAPPNSREINSQAAPATDGVSTTSSGHSEVPHSVVNSVKAGPTEQDTLRSGQPASSNIELVAKPSLATQNGGDGHGEGTKKDSVDLSNTVCSRRAAKVKQFFSTIQQCANNLGRDVAEQVQELIYAVMNGTATAEEFHQEIQTVTNYPLKSFTIPFIKENIKYLQAELKDSAQALSDILGTVPNSSTVALTPQADEDDELPVLPSSSKSMTLPTIRSVSSSIIHSNSTKTPVPSSSVPSSSSSFSSSSSLQTAGTPRSALSHSVTSNPTSSPSHGTEAIVQARSLSTTTSTVTMVEPGNDGFDTIPRVQGNGVPAMYSTRKRLRKPSMDKGTSTICESQVIASDKQQVQGSVLQQWPKRPRGEVSDGMVIVTNPPRPPPSFPHPPPPPTTHIVGGVPATRPSSADKQAAYSPFPSPQEHLNSRRRGSFLSEDWGYLDTMLNTVQGMVERTRQSLASLKDRVHSTHVEMERKEVDHDHIIQQRVAEAVEKVRRQANEERQRLLVEANKQVRDAVATVRAEMEQKMQQAQNAAVQEALKEANMQTSSKENCWNCGRRATETCSGCNKARYCGAFCQHKDWANHMHHCASGLQGQAEEQIYSGGRDAGRPQHHHQVAVALSSGEVALATTNRTLVPQSHQRAMAIPVTMINRPQERSVRLSQHPEIIIKSEKA